MNKDRCFCTRKNCLTLTCSRHKNKIPKWYNVPINWKYYEDCDMYTGFDKMPKRNTQKDSNEEDIF